MQTTAPIGDTRADALGWLASPRALLPRGRTLPEDVWWGRHQAVLGLLWLHALAIPIYALIQGFSLGHTALESSIVPIAAIAAGLRTLDRRTRTAIASLGLLTSSGILVHLSGGVIEMHFHFFVMVTVVALYQDWLPFLAAIAYVLVHHGLLGVIDPDSVFNHQAAWNSPWKWAGIHALFIAGISAVCLVTWRLNEVLLAHNARLFQSEHEARVTAERAGDRLVLLADVGRVLTSSFQVDAILRSFAERASASLGDVCIVDLVEEDGSLRRVAVASGSGMTTLVEGIRNASVDVARASNPIVAASRSREERFLSTNALATLDLEHLTSDLEDGADVSAIVVPITGRERAVGVLSFVGVSNGEAKLRDEDVPLVEELARRAASAVENAFLYARQRSVAETLQHSLLPQRLPEVPGFQLAARYIAGGPDVEVGGDWYDVIQLGGGSIALIMGDVAGRGEEAAALMGQLKSAARAYSYEDRPPTEVMSGVNGLVYEFGSDQLATMAYATLNSETGELRVVSAGHPPALVVRPDGSAEYLGNAGGPPIGSTRQARYIEAATVLEPGSTLLLYTDGLVEDRDTPLDTGLRILKEAAEGTPDDPTQLCERIVERATVGRAAEDDIALLAVRYMKLDRRLHLLVGTQPTVLAPLRAALRRWLIGQGVDEENAFEILTACGEAASNAIRHGANPGYPYFEVTGLVEKDVTISIRDWGTWRPPRISGGGRGLGIIENLMDDVEVRKDSTGTEVRMRRAIGTLKTVP